MTRHGDQRSIISIQCPDSLTRTLRRGCLMDKQHPHHCFLGSPRLTLPPTSQPFTKAGPHPHPPATQQAPPSSLPMGYGNQPTPNPEQDTPVGEGCFLTQTPKFTLESPKSPWGLRWGQVPWAATLALVTRTPDQGRDLHSIQGRSLTPTGFQSAQPSTETLLLALPPCPTSHNPRH